MRMQGGSSRTLAAAMVLLAGIGASAPFTTAAQARVTEITFSLVCGSDERPGWQGITDAFNKQSTDTHVKLEVLAGGWTEYVQQMLLRAASGTSPDIGRMGVAYMPHFKRKGLLTNLMPYAVQDKYDMSLYYSAAFRGLVKGNVLYGLPAGIYSMANFYNRTLFEQAGLPAPNYDWDKAWTWDEFRDVARKLTKTVSGQKPTQWGYSIDWSVERSLQYVWQAGGDFFSADGTKCAMGSPQAIGALHYLQDLVWKDGSAGTGLDFTAGKLGMFQEGTWMMPTMAKIKKFKVGVSPMPRGAAGAATEIYVDPYVIFQGSKHKKEAWKVVKFFTERAAENVLVDKELMGVPVLKSVAVERRADMFKTLAQEDKDTWLTSIEHTREVPFTTNWLDMMAAYNARIAKVANNTTTVDEAAKGIVADMNKLLARSK